MNKVESDSTELPYAYYDLPFVCPKHDKRLVHLFLGEIIKGDRIFDSDYHIFFEKDEPCKRICDRITKQLGIKRADELIRKGYVVEWIIDDLPSATTFISSTNNDKYYAAGFPLGFVQDGKTYLHNHVMMVIRWHKEKGDPTKKTIVGFEIYPRSVSDFHCPGASRNFENFELDPSNPRDVLIPFTYAVYWREEKDVNWYKRWDLYFAGEVRQEKIHWLSLINSFVLVLLLSAIVGVVLVRTLNKDITSYKRSKYDTKPTGKKFHISPSSDSFTEEVNKMLRFDDLGLNDMDDSLNSGWRSIVNDVSTMPDKPLILAILAGTGIQLLFTTIAVAVLCASGVLGPEHRGSVISFSILLFVLAGYTSGFAGIQFYKRFTGESYTRVNWVSVSMYCGGGFTGAIFTIVLILNLFVWAKDSSTALPFGTIMALFLLFLLLEIPLSILGGYVSSKRNISSSITVSSSSTFLPGQAIPMTNIQKSNNNTPGILDSTPIPRQPFYNSLWFAIPVFGIIPFGIIYVELLFVFKSIWLEKTTFYYMYGFLLATIMLLMVVVIEITIVSTYLSLNCGDYRWQWRSFIILGGSIAFYIFFYGIYYFIVYLKVVDFISALLYFIYIMIISTVIGLACGSIGLTCSLYFISKIYNAIKVD